MPYEYRDHVPVVSFRDGFKYVDGARHTITGVREERSSNGETIYTALMWSDGKASCNCPGWATSRTRDKKTGAPRDKACSHSKKVRAGDNIRLTGGAATVGTGRVEAATRGRKIQL